MPIKTRKIIVKVPHRISGFFEIVDEREGKKILNPEEIGSRGAGFNLKAFGATKIEVDFLSLNDESDCSIYINNERLDHKAETTFYIYSRVKELLKKPFKARISHYFDLPIGSGYGASGSGALGSIVGLSKLLKLKLNFKEMGRIAHIAEVVNKTGLGTVCGQIGGGLCMLIEPGYPCHFKRINVPKGIKVICTSFGMIHTKSILSNPNLNALIKEEGKKALKKLMINPTIQTFIDASIEFVKNTRILEILELDKVKELMDELNRLNILGASMNQLGKSVYAICKEQDLNLVMEIFESFNNKKDIYISEIYKKNPILIQK
ncbi:MAG: GHMP family kinase ATP-binding protein [Promethearchaeota archaeon]